MKKIEEKLNTSTAKIAVYYTLSNFLAKGIIVITTPLFTRLLSKSEYGMFAVFLSMEGIFTIISSLDLQSSIFRAKYDYKEEMDKYLGSILIAANIATVFIYLLIECNQSLFKSIFIVDIQYVRMFFVYMLFSPAFTFLQIKHRIYKKYQHFIVFSILSSILKVFLSIICVLFFEDKLSGRIVGYLVPVTVLNIGIWFNIIRKGKKPSCKHICYALSISLPLLPHALSNNLLSSSDRIMISQMCGAESTSFYSISYMVCMMASLLWTSMNQAWSPWLFDCMALGKKDIIFSKSRLYVGVFASVIVLLLLLAPEMILLFGGKQYLEAQFVMPPIIVGFMFQFVYGMYVNIEIYMKKTIAISIGTVSAAAINIALNWLLLPKFGYISAAYTTLAGYFLLYIFHYRMVKKIGKFTDIYDEKFIQRILVLMLSIGFLSLNLYQHNKGRYFLLICYVIVMLFKYKQIKRYFFQ